jgi:Tol biopolymer transport system component
MTESTLWLRERLHAVALRAPRTGAMPRRLRRRAILAMVRTALGATVLVAALTSAGIYLNSGIRTPDASSPAKDTSAPPERIAFVSDRDGDDDVYSAVVGSQAATNLTANDLPDSSPAWSPDGSRIAFSSEEEGRWDVYVMQADGSDLARVVSDGTQPAWSPDGTRIAFARIANPEASPLSQIFVVTLSTGAVERITNEEAGAIQPAWSPGGTSIAYSSRGRIEVVEADGANERTVTDGDLDMNPMWISPGELLFSRETALAGDRALSNVFAIDLGGEPARRLTTVTGRSAVPESSSPDGKRVLVTLYGAEGADVFLMDRNGDDLRPLIEGPANDSQAAWQPVP